MGFIIWLVFKRKFSVPLYLPSSNLQQEDSLNNLTELLVLFGSNSNNTAYHTHLRQVEFGILLNQSIEFKLKDTGTHTASHIRIRERYFSIFPDAL